MKEIFNLLAVIFILFGVINLFSTGKFNTKSLIFSGIQILTGVAWFFGRGNVGEESKTGWTP